MKFSELEIIEPILNALYDEGYSEPTPVQARAIPLVLDGYDLLASAQTGTGKTAAFSIPIIQHLYMEEQLENPSHRIKALIRLGQGLGILG